MPTVLFLRLIVIAVGVSLVHSLLFNAIAYALRWWTWVPSCEDDEPLGPFTAMAAFVVECLALSALTITQPLGWLMRPGHLTGPRRGTDPIVLIHGWGLNAASMWVLRHRLVRHGFGPLRTFCYASHCAEVESAAARLRAVIGELHRQQPGPITLIAHGFGGLVARYYLRRYPLEGVRRLITIGTPHRGTLAAGRGARQLRPNSPLVQRLNAADHVPDQFEVIAISSPFDALVIPHGYAEYPGAYIITIHAVGHYALLCSSRVFALIRENLRERVGSAAAR